MIEMMLWPSETALTDAIFDDTLLLPLVDAFSVIRYLSFEIYNFSTKRIYKVFEFQILSFYFDFNLFGGKFKQFIKDQSFGLDCITITSPWPLDHLQ